MKNKNLALLLSLCVIIIVIALYILLLPHDRQSEKQSISDMEIYPPSYVGADACAGCHQQQYILWQGSHHDHSMQVVNDETVLGDFNDTEFAYFDVTSKFYEKTKLV